MNPAYFAHIWLSNALLYVRYINENLLLYFGFTLALLCMLGISIYFRPKNKTVSGHYVPSMTRNDTDLSSIAGEDVVATQLDLAKAYIEMNQKTLAKPILNNVIKSGNHQQKQEARQLIDSL